jgi:hypothetical protein
LLSFYIPTFVIIVIYLKIFLVIRSRASFAQNKIVLNLKRISIKKKQHNNVNEHVDNKTTKPVLIETNLDQNNLENEQKFNSSNKKKKNNEKRDSDVSLAFLPNTEITTNNNNNNNNNKRESTVTVDGKQMIIKPKKSVASFASKKEKKVTKTLAIVLIVYLVCWLIFIFL